MRISIRLTFEKDELPVDYRRGLISLFKKAIERGIVAHSSGETTTLTPLFLIAGNDNVPSPVFHSLNQ